MTTITGSLDSWRAVSARREWPSLLIGNGSSIAVSHRFAYARLKDEAPLTPADDEIFTGVGTEDFEQVLAALNQAALVCDALGHSSQDAMTAYASVRDALLIAVRKVHLQHREVPTTTLLAIEDALAAHRSVYTTNYDLLTYWAIMSRDEGPRIRDYFWNSGASFNIRDVESWDDTSTVLWLHGGLHLYLDSSTGLTKKLTGGGLLSAPLLTASSSRTPLFVSEGRSRDKLRSIRGSDYLTFAHERLVQDDSPMVIFGHSLGNGDAHIAESICASPRRSVAVALLPDTERRIIARKAYMLSTLTNQRLSFFDATTHPLGDGGLLVP